MLSLDKNDDSPIDYPPIFLSCAVDDSRVPYWAPLKWAERLRTATETDNLVVRIHKAGEGGHFGTTSAPQNYEETCREMSFMFRSLGLQVKPLKREKKVKTSE